MTPFCHQASKLRFLVDGGGPIRQDDATEVPDRKERPEEKSVIDRDGDVMILDGGLAKAPRRGQPLGFLMKLQKGQIALP